MKLVKICKEESYFTICSESYKPLKKAPIWNLPSPFMNEIIISNLETKLASIDTKVLEHRRYLRYSHEKRCAIACHDLHNRHYGVHPRGRKGRSIIFLEPFVQEKAKKIDLEIYRKPKDTKRVITNPSSHAHHHKAASFNRMIHRTLHPPFASESMMKDWMDTPTISSLISKCSPSWLWINSPDGKQLWNST